MSKITTTTWPIEAHTEAKHAILRRYLDAWLPIITRWNGRVLYIDGFAGPGEYVGGKEGSPIIAINAVKEHRAQIKSEIRMFFIEADEKRCEFLKQKIAMLTIPTNVKPECFCAKFDETLKKLLDYIDEQKTRLAPAFVFIDPFGFTGMPFALIKRIMGNGKCEVLITFMYEEINRFVSDKKLWENLKELYGTDEWMKVIPMKNPQQRAACLHDIYRKQLENEAGIKFVRSFKMVNKVNKTDYFLFFGTNNILGLKKMKEAMWKIDKIGQFQFSDATHNPNQPVLFETGPDYNLLRKIILQNFQHKSVSVAELENFILTQTPFRETHYKRQILVPMEKSQSSQIKIKCSGKRIKGSFLGHYIIEFL